MIPQTILSAEAAARMQGEAEGIYRLPNTTTAERLLASWVMELAQSLYVLRPAAMRAPAVVPGCPNCTARGDQGEPHMQGCPKATPATICRGCDMPTACCICHPSYKGCDPSVGNRLAAALLKPGVEVISVDRDDGGYWVVYLERGKRRQKRFITDGLPVVLDGPPQVTHPA